MEPSQKRANAEAAGSGRNPDDPAVPGSRVRRHEALSESDQRYRALFESAAVGIFLLRGDRFVDCNQRGLELFGCEREQLIGKSPFAFSPPRQPDGSDSWEGAIERIKLALEGQTLHFEWQHRRWDGTLFDAEVTLNRVVIAGEVHLIGMVRDVTEHKRAQEDLRRGQEELQGVLASIPDYLWSADMDSHGHVTHRYYSPVVERITGRSPEFFLRGPERWLSTVHPDDLPRIQIALEALTTGKVPQLIEEYRIILPDGTVRWVRDNVQVRQHHGGTRFDGVVSDITERKRAEDALRASESRYRLLFENNVAAIICSTLDGRIIDGNEPAARILGFEAAQEMLDVKMKDIYWDPKKRRALVARLKTLKSLAGVEMKFRHKNGKPAWVIANLNLTVAEDTGETFIQGSLVDITERKRAEEERQRTFEQLRALTGRLQSIREEERTRVAREIHDQLGQALTAIKIELSSLVRELPADDKPPSKRTASILKLVDESIRTVRRISTELRPGILDDLGLVAALEWAGEDFQARTGTTCRMHLPQASIAASPEQATAIFRIFQETLTNVARHAHASAVEVRFAEEDGGLMLEVYDNGKGIPDDKLRASKSLGILGMRERAMLLGGELTIKGFPGNGTTMRVRIPEAGRTWREPRYDQSPDR